METSHNPSSKDLLILDVAQKRTDYSQMNLQQDTNSIFIQGKLAKLAISKAHKTNTLYGTTCVIWVKMK